MQYVQHCYLHEISFIGILEMNPQEQQCFMFICLVYIIEALPYTYVYTRWLYHVGMGFLFWNHIVTHNGYHNSESYINYSKLFNLNSHCYIILYVRWYIPYEFPSGFAMTEYRKYWQRSKSKTRCGTQFDKWNFITIRVVFINGSVVVTRNVSFLDLLAFCQLA